MRDRLFPHEQARIVQLLVQRGDVTAKGADIRIRADGLRSLAAVITGPRRTAGRRAIYAGEPYACDRRLEVLRAPELVTIICRQDFWTATSSAAIASATASTAWPWLSSVCLRPKPISSSAPP
jgi:hypothetical protein